MLSSAQSPEKALASLSAHSSLSGICFTHNFLWLDDYRTQAGLGVQGTVTFSQVFERQGLFLPSPPGALSKPGAELLGMLLQPHPAEPWEPLLSEFRISINRPKILSKGNTLRGGSNAAWAPLSFAFCMDKSQLCA